MARAPVYGLPRAAHIACATRPETPPYLNSSEIRRFVDTVRSPPNRGLPSGDQARSIQSLYISNLLSVRAEPYRLLGQAQGDQDRVTRGFEVRQRPVLYIHITFGSQEQIPLLQTIRYTSVLRRAF